MQPPLDATQGFLLTQEIVAFLRASSEMRPLGLVLEDMHWADAASWDVLEHVLAHRNVGADDLVGRFVDLEAVVAVEG